MVEIVWNGVILCVCSLRCTSSLELTHTLSQSYCFFCFCFPEADCYTFISTPSGRSSLRRDLTSHGNLRLLRWRGIWAGTAFSASRLRGTSVQDFWCVGGRVCLSPAFHKTLLRDWSHFLQSDISKCFLNTRTQSGKIFLIRISWFIKKSVYSFSPSVTFCQSYRMWYQFSLNWQ